jgi:hypothetical protein
MCKIFCLLQFLPLIYGFNIRQSGLQNIIATRAFVTTLTEKINTEIISDNNLLNEISNAQYSHHIENMFYVGMYTTILYSAIVYFTYSKDASTQIEKLNNIEMFSNTKKRFNMLLIVLILLFTKNIENAI